MYNFDLKLPTIKKTPGENKCNGIIIHRISGGAFNSSMRYFSKSLNKKSIHFVVGERGQIGKIGVPKDILWHTEYGSWGDSTNLNQNMIGIQVVGFGEYNKGQYHALTNLVKYLIKTFNINKENIIRHSDCTQSKEFTSKKTLWNGKRRVRGWGIGPKFFPEGFAEWRDNLDKHPEGDL